jgi:hypothetical protein
MFVLIDQSKSERKAFKAHTRQPARRYQHRTQALVIIGALEQRIHD